MPYCLVDLVVASAISEREVPRSDKELLSISMIIFSEARSHTGVLLGTFLPTLKTTGVLNNIPKLEPAEKRVQKIIRIGPKNV